MNKHEQILYTPVENGSNEDLPLKRVRKPSTLRFNFQHLLLLEGIHLVLILGGYILFVAAKYGVTSSNVRLEVHGLDTCK
jgi:hypothetical protein